MAMEEDVVASALIFGADLDPCLGDLDDLEGNAPNKLHFAWDGLDDWLREETCEIKGEELMGAVITPCEEDDTPPHTHYSWYLPSLSYCVSNR
jgi:hypothetical protein